MTTICRPPVSSPTSEQVSDPYLYVTAHFLIGDAEKNLQILNEILYRTADDRAETRFRRPFMTGVVSESIPVIIEDDKIRFYEYLVFNDIEIPVQEIIIDKTGLVTHKTYAGPQSRSLFGYRSIYGLIDRIEEGMWYGPSAIIAPRVISERTFLMTVDESTFMPELVEAAKSIYDCGGS